MKLLILTCLVASALTAPTAKTKRNILPGDPRYDSTHHDHHHEHHHHENEIEISKALGGYTGSFSVPDEFSGLSTGASSGSTDFFKQDIDVSKASIHPDVVTISGHKFNEGSKSSTDSSTAVPKVVSVSVVKADSVELLPQTKDVNAAKDSATNTETNIETKSTNAGDISSDVSKSTVQSASVGFGSSGTALSGDVGLPTGSLATPFQSNFDSSFGSSFDSNFGSSFDSGFGSSLGQSSFPSVLRTSPSYSSDFSSFSQSGYNPSFHSVGGYTPGFENLNTNFEQFNSNGAEFRGYPLNFGQYSGFEQTFKQTSIPSYNPVNFPNLKSESHSQNVPYLPPHTESQSSFPGDFANQAPSSEFKFSPQESYLTPSFQQNGQQFETVVPQNQQQVFKNYSPAPLTIPTNPPASFHKSFVPDSTITKGSLSGISQLTDVNGGYVY